MSATCESENLFSFWPRTVKHPEVTALVESDAAEHTFGTFGAFVNRLSSGLLNYGVRPGAIVACSAPNGKLFLGVQLAVLQMGAYFLPLDVRLATPEVIAILAKSRPV